MPRVPPNLFFPSPAAQAKKALPKETLRGECRGQHLFTSDTITNKCASTGECPKPFLFHKLFFFRLQGGRKKRLELSRCCPAEQGILPRLNEQPLSDRNPFLKEGAGHKKRLRAGT